MFQSHAAALLRRFVHDVEGATAIEYALVASGIAGAIISVVWGLGRDITTAFYDGLIGLF
jgi:pilus assembly protein Flp/PilA